MNSTRSVFSATSSQYVPSDVFCSDQPSTSCTADKQTPSPAQCFLTHSNGTCHPECDGSTSTASSEDLSFVQKCADLQNIVRPLLELLHGLKSGRFDKGLTNFQQSVAIDRLQRILGILQKPDMGEKYLQNLLKIEAMLKMWFPHCSAKTDQMKISSKFCQHCCQNQLHVPVKKRKMSWTDPDCSDAVSVKHKQDKQMCYAVTSLNAVCICDHNKKKTLKATTKRLLECISTSGPLKDMTPSCKQDKMPHCSTSAPSPATQDNFVSSSTTKEDSL